jgi:hypothetical protein
METVEDRRLRRLLWLIEQEGGLDPADRRPGGHYVIANYVSVFEETDTDPTELAQYLRQIINFKDKPTGRKNVTPKMVKRIEDAYEANGQRHGVRKGWFDALTADEIATAIGHAPINMGEQPHVSSLTNIRFAPQDRQPGLVYSWDEVVRMFRAGVEEHLPDVFSVELTDDALPGRARKGDIVTLSRSKASTVEAGDGVLVRTSNDHYALRIYRPKGDGTWHAEATNQNFKPLHNIEDGLTILAVVIGTPACRWSSL